jgi:hypothetical protein
MADWEPIKRTGRPDPKGIHERMGGRIELHFPVLARPPREWAEYFEELHTRQNDYPPLRVQGT